MVASRQGTVQRAIAFALALCGLGGSSAHAHQHGVETVRFQHYGVDEGLSQSSIRVLAQDRTGFLWMGTQDGLNRFDSYAFRVFRHDAQAADSLADSHVTALETDPAGGLWVGTQAGGLAYLPPAAETFVGYRHRDGQAQSLASNPVSALRLDTRGRLWAASGTGSLQWLDTATGTFSAVPVAATVPFALIRVIRERHDSTFVVGGRGGLWLVDAQGIGLRELRASDGASIDTYDVIEAPSGAIDVASTGSGVFRFDAEGNAIAHIDVARGLSGNTTRALLLDNHQRLWVATYDGLSRIDPDGRVASWRNMSGNEGSLASNRVQSLLQDRSGLIWVGTWLNGLSVFNPRAEAFIDVRHVPGDATSLPSGAAPGVHADDDGTLWLGLLEGGGLVHFDLQRGVLARYVNDPADPSSLSRNDVQHVLRDRHGVLWVGTLGGGLLRLKADGSGFDRFRHDPNDAGSIPSDAIQRLYLDSKNTLWVGTVADGLGALCDGCTQFKNYRDRAGDEDALGGDSINAILEDQRGDFWLGLRPGGLARLDRDSGKVEHFRANATDSLAISYDTITALVEDAGVLWVGTQGGGINRVDRDTHGKVLGFRAYTRHEGLASDAIGGIATDARGRIWMSTTAGVSSLEPASGKIENFGAREGAQGSGYFIGAYDTMPTGALVFGGPRGITVFDPAAIEPTPVPAVVAVTELRTVRTHSASGNGAPRTRLDTAADGLPRIALVQGADDFSLTFSALNYADPKSVVYSYRLDDLDQAWIDTDALHRYASYNSVTPGDYLLRLRARLPGGAYSPETRMHVHLPNPPWATAWATAGYLVLALSVLAVVAWQARQRLRERARAGRSLARSEERLKLALWGTGDELWDIDIATGELRRSNPLQHLKATPVAYLPNARELIDQMHSDDRPAFNHAFAEHVRGHSEFFEATYRAQDRGGNWRWLRSRGRVSRFNAAGRALRIAGTTEDITDLKEHEQALERINQDLERRVRDRTADLTIANDSLRQTIEQLRQTQHQLVESEKMAALGGLVAGVAHEINTPLGIGVTAASHLEAETQRILRLMDAGTLARADLQAFQKVALESSQLILRNLQRADKLVKSFKQVAVDQSSEHRRRITLRAYIDEILTSLHPALKKTRHKVEVECPGTLIFDTYPGAIYQLLVNLVMNSLLHGFEGVDQGNIRIVASAAAGQVSLIYTDDGRGMNDEVRRRIFEPFFTTKRGQGGSGLGMHIAYNLTTQVLRGTIVCESTLGKGVRFVVRFPVELVG